MFPPDVAPPPAAPPTAPAAPAGKVLTPTELGAWKRRATAALEGTKPAIEQGRTNVQRYTGKYLSGTPTDDTCLVPTDFYYVESKKAQVFYRLPDVFVKPEMPGLEDASVVFQAALNKKLGPKGVNVLPTVKQVVFDVLCPTGFGAVSIGYQTALGEPPTIDIPMGPPMADPLTGALTPAPTMPAPNIVAAWYFIEHIKPGDLLVPPEFVGIDFDKAPWIGMRFKEDVKDSTDGADSDTDDRRLTPLPSGAQSAMRKQRVGCEIWYKAHLFDADVQHPDKIRTFTYYEDDNESKPVQVRDHPHQRYKTPAGELLKGMQGYPISPVTLRYVSDTWMAPSDATMARNTADELSKGRTQMLRSRDRNMPQWGFDATRVDKDIQGKIERNEIQGGVPFNGPGQDATWPIQKGNAPKETYNFNDVAQGDLARIWRMGSNQIGVLDDTGSRTATEQQITQNAAQEAHESDRATVLSWYVDKVVAKFASLLQLYATEQEFVELVGSDAQRLKSIPPEVMQQAKAAGQDARVLVPWNKESIEGLYSFSARPNSQLYIDAAQEKKQLMDLYNFFANEPTVNRGELTRAILTRYGFDPSKMMQQPPPKQSPPPTIAVSVKGDDMNPLMPQSPIVLDLLSKTGVPIDLNAIAAAQQVAALVPPELGPDGQHGAQPQTEHGGATAQAEPMSKHPAEQTGNMQGSGQPAAVAPGGHL